MNNSLSPRGAAHRWPLVFGAPLLLALVGGCESDPSEADTQAAETDDSGDPSDGGSEPGWQLTYSGAHEGEIFGPQTSAVAIADTVSFGGSNLSFDAAYSIVGTLPIAEGETGMVDADNFSAQLADGTVCDVVDDNPVSVTVTNGDPDDYSMTFEGTRDCDGESITVEGYLRRS